MTFRVDLPDTGVFAAWRQAVKSALNLKLAPEQLEWSGQASLFQSPPLPVADAAAEMRVSKAYLDVAQNVIWHSDAERFALLYQAIWRLMQGDATAISAIDPLGRRLQLMAKAVRRDIHKMHAFVRFRELPSVGDRRSFAAWFEPEHQIVEPGTRFFSKRFSDMDWMIATPQKTAVFADGHLRFEPGSTRPDLPEDASEALWGTYFANIFNPARVKLNAMRSEMPKKYWANLPETRLIPAMLADAEARVKRMQEAGASTARPGAAQISTRYRAQMPQAVALPETLEEARAAALQCRRCVLCEPATQTVWGEGAGDARLMIVGEQPGDQEDLAGRPFVGPAGQLLREILGQVGVGADQIYLTNAVKHFKFVPRGKRRIHDTANAGEVQSCRWWLELETQLVRPELVLALGATAARSLTGNAAALGPRRGMIERGIDDLPVKVSWHPSYILRITDPAAKAQALDELRQDVRAAWALAMAA